jgi:undecaprenyl-phosphate 4-deoxy-4-formamido-L-arabinose transferase
LSSVEHERALRPVDTISVVIPVYSGAETLAGLVAEIEAVREVRTPEGRRAVLAEVILVWDNGPDDSDDVIRALAAAHDWVRPVWLSRNFGQHAATIAGMASSGSDWIVTMDEDGQHDPASIGVLLDAAYAARAHVVYARPSNPPPHGALRNLASRLAKGLVARALTGGSVSGFHSFRLVAGDVGRSMAAYAGPGVYLDVALSWVTTRVAWAPVAMRSEGRPASSYTWRSLASHMWRLVLSSGNRPLRLISGFGAICATVGVLYALYLVIARISGATQVDGWTSAVVSELVLGGIILLSLGVIAEYVGLAATMSMGKPGFVVLDDPDRRFGTEPDAP